MQKLRDLRSIPGATKIRGGVAVPRGAYVGLWRFVQGKGQVRPHGRLVRKHYTGRMIPQLLPKTVKGDVIDSWASTLTIKGNGRYYRNAVFRTLDPDIVDWIRERSNRHAWFNYVLAARVGVHRATELEANPDTAAFIARAWPSTHIDSRMSDDALLIAAGRIPRIRWGLFLHLVHSAGIRIGTARCVALQLPPMLRPTRTSLAWALDYASMIGSRTASVEHALTWGALGAPDPPLMTWQVAHLAQTFPGALVNPYAVDWDNLRFLVGLLRPDLRYLLS